MLFPCYLYLVWRFLNYWTKIQRTGLFSNDRTNYVSLYTTWSRALLFENYLRGRGNLEGWGQDVKYSTTQLIVPRSKLWSIFALCYDLNLGIIFYFNQDFSGSGVVLGLSPPQPLPYLKNLGLNKRLSLDFVS